MVFSPPTLASPARGEGEDGGVGIGRIRCGPTDLGGMMGKGNFSHGRRGLWIFDRTTRAVCT